MSSKNKKILKTKHLGRNPSELLRHCSRMRFAVFTHDTFGLGHVRRCLHITRKLAQYLPEASILLITGSPAYSFLKDLPPNADCLKIPTIVKTGASGSSPSHLPLSISEMTFLRARIIQEALLSFQPDVFMVDNFPLGSQSELLAVLKLLKILPTKIILGLRDILDAPEVVQGDWKRQGIYDVLDRYYDKIFIYGSKNILDAAKAYALPASIARKIHYCGYLTETEPVISPATEIRRQLGVKGPLVLVTGGGGGDAFPVIDIFLKAMKQLSNVTALVLTGPLMGREDRRQLQQQLNGHSKIILKDFVSDMPSHLKAADVVISMCGYNTAAEILVHQPKAIVIPRTWKYGEHRNRAQVVQEHEQIIRAHALARLGLVHLIEMENLTPERLVKMIYKIFKFPKKKKRPAINLNGLEVAVSEIIKLHSPKM